MYDTQKNLHKWHKIQRHMAEVDVDTHTTLTAR